MTGGSERPGPVIEQLDGPAAERAVDDLATILLDVVKGGASVGFLAPLDRDRARRFWHRVVRQVEAGETILLVARLDGRVVGTVSVHLVTMENQQHRFEIAKMQVHRAVRRRGVAALLLHAAERAASAAGRSVGVLDTVTGSDADRLYRRAGWVAAGEIPDYARYPDGTPCPTTFFYKLLGLPPV